MLAGSVSVHRRVPPEQPDVDATSAARLVPTPQQGTFTQDLRWHRQITGASKIGATDQWPISLNFLPAFVTKFMKSCHEGSRPVVSAPFVPLTICTPF